MGVSPLPRLSTRLTRSKNVTFVNQLYYIKLDTLRIARSCMKRFVFISVPTCLPKGGEPWGACAALFRCAPPAPSKQYKCLCRSWEPSGNLRRVLFSARLGQHQNKTYSWSCRNLRKGFQRGVYDVLCAPRIEFVLDMHCRSPDIQASANYLYSTYSHTVVFAHGACVA